MINQFAYSRASSSEDADQKLAAVGAAPLGGGTDLVVCIREHLARPEALVDMMRIPDAQGVIKRSDGGSRIGGSPLLARLARHPLVRDRFSALGEACESVGTPALRTMGTIAGNLCQRPRCWYLRSGFACHKNGGDSCPAASGENQYHAILGGGPCYIVHPSDAAVALTALEAVVEIRGASTVRQVPVAEFFVLPSERLDHETVLRAGEFVSAIEVPGASAGGV